MRSRRITSWATADIDRLYDQLEESSTKHIADKFTLAVFRAFNFLNEFPESGAPLQTEVLSLQSVYYWTIKEYPRYVIYYRFSETDLSILRVLHGSRLAVRLLKETN